MPDNKADVSKLTDDYDHSFYASQEGRVEWFIHRYII